MSTPEPDDLLCAYCEEEATHHFCGTHAPRVTTADRDALRKILDVTRERNATIERLTRERDEARAEIARLRAWDSGVEAAGAPQNAERTCPSCGARWMTAAENLHPAECPACKWKPPAPAEPRGEWVAVVELDQRGCHGAHDVVMVQYVDGEEVGACDVARCPSKADAEAVAAMLRAVGERLRP